MLYGFSHITGKTCFAILIDRADGKYVNGSATEVFNSAHWASYKWSVSDPSGVGFYGLQTFTSCPDGRYWALGFEQAGTPSYANDVGLYGTHLDLADVKIVGGVVVDVAAVAGDRMDLTDAALVRMVSDDTGETSAAARSVAKLAQGSGGGSGGVTGPGADECTLVFTNSTSGLPVADADVWVTSDAAGTDVVAGTLQTDSQGQATFLLDAGDVYYFWAQKNGVNAIRGQQFTAEAD